MFEATIFWQANIWGIIGTLLGGVALGISLANQRSSRPRLVITKLDLVRKSPPQVSEWFEHKSKEGMRDHILYFELNISMRNESTSSFSIGKPTLVFSLPSGKQLRLRPYRAHEAADKTNASAWNSKGSQLETVWEFKGSQMLDDEIRYVVENMVDLYEIVDNYSLTTYSIEYTDNRGRKHTRDITSVFEES